MLSLLFFSLAPALPFAVCERFLKDRRFTRARLQKSLDFVQYTFDRRDNEAAILLAAYGAGTFFQSQPRSELGRNHKLPLGADRY